MEETVSPRVAWLVLFGAFLAGVEIAEKLLDSEQTDTGESCDCGDRASSWMGKQRRGSIIWTSAALTLKITPY